MFNKHTIHKVLKALLEGEFRRLDDMDYESFAGAGPLALIWYGPNCCFILDPTPSGVLLHASSQDGSEREFDWAKNEWRRL